MEMQRTIKYIFYSFAMVGATIAITVIGVDGFLEVSEWLPFLLLALIFFALADYLNLKEIKRMTIIDSSYKTWKESANFKKFIKLFVIIILIAGVIIWIADIDMIKYRYIKAKTGGFEMIYKINRFSGETWIITPSGIRKLKKRNNE